MPKTERARSGKRPPPVLVTGGTGFLGQHLVHLLREDNDAGPLRVLSTASSMELSEKGIDCIEGSVTSEHDVARALEGIRQVYHLAGRVSRNPDDQRLLYDVHVEGTRLLCRAAARAGVERVVMASTSGTIAVTEDGDRVHDETAPPPLEIIGRWPYYTSKLYQEEVARQECEGGPELVILNPSLLLGPGDDRLSSTQDILRFLSGDIPVIPPGGLSFVDVRDVAPAFLAAMRGGRSGERYLLGGPNCTFEKLFGRLERLSKVRAPKLRLPEPLFVWAGKAMDSFYETIRRTPPVDKTSVEMSRYFWYVDSAKAKAELGFRARDPYETLYDTVSYIQKQFLGQRVFS